MYFIPENYTFTEAIFMLLTEPIIIAAGAFALIATMLLSAHFLSAHYMYNESDPSLFKIWTVIPVLGVISGLLTSLIFALAITTLVDLDKGYYEATGTIESIEHHTEYAGQTDGDFTIGLLLDNGDPVDIQMPLQSPESIEPGDTFTLQSERLFNRNEVKNFTPIENLSYSPSRQSLSGKQFLGPRFAVDLIVEGDVIKGDSD